MFKCNSLRWGLIAIGVVLSSGTSFAAPADKNIIASLTAVDKSLSQGIIVYSLKGKIAGKTYDQYDGKIIYLSNGRFEEDLNFTGQHATSVTYWDGKNTISQTKNTDRSKHTISPVSIDPTEPPEFLPNSAPDVVRPGASFVLGRGLSCLNNLRVVSVSRTSATVAGTCGDSSPATVVTAEIDPHNNWLAKRIEIDFPMAQAGKTLRAIFTFGPPMRTASGQIIASSATYAVPEKNFRAHFIIRHANFARPTLSIPTSVSASNYVADMRAGRTILLHLPRTLTLDQILAVTRRQAAQLAAQDAQDKATEKALQK